MKFLYAATVFFTIGLALAKLAVAITVVLFPWIRRFLIDA